MRHYFLLFFISSLTYSSKAQLSDAFPIYFENDVTAVSYLNQQHLINKFKTIDTSMVESITFVAYNDDTGSPKYNINLSEKRSKEILSILNENQLFFKIDILIKGIIKTEIKKIYSEEYIKHLRNKDRRIDVTINYKGRPTYAELANAKINFKIEEGIRAGDRIYLEKIVFPIDRSVLTKEISEALNLVALQLIKFVNLQVEIQGHICCTDNVNDAVDLDTGKTELSINRAKAVYQYLIKKGVNPKRLRYKGYGNKKPLGFDPEFDKRVEFYVIKS